MPFCPQCGLKIEPAFGVKCANNHPYVAADEDEVSVAAEQLERGFVETFFLMKHNFALSEAAGLFLQASHCCKNKDYDACAVMCRAALESALAKLRIINPSATGIYSIDSTVLGLLPEIQFHHGRLVRWARKNGVLTRELANKVEQVRDLGNFATHLAESKYREVAQKVKQSKPYRLWVAPEEAYWALNIARQTILHLTEWFASKNSF